MEIYESRYFAINKKLLSFFGIWPYENRRKKVCLRIYYCLLLVFMSIPHFIGVRKKYGLDLERTIEHIGVIMYTSLILMKMITSIVTEKQLKIMYDDLSSNWKVIKDEKEMEKLAEYSENGRKLTIAYILYIILALIIFCSLPWTPIILDKLIPLNESRPYIYVLNGEFLVDKDKNYGKIFLFDLATCVLSASIIMAVDTTYAACIEHCLGLFSIVKYRLRMPNKLVLNEGTHYVSKQVDPTYDWVKHTIKLHKRILKFTNTLETSYSSSFLIIMGINVMYFSLISALILLCFRTRPIDAMRYFMLMLGLLIHIFYLSWPGQKLIDHSTGLFQDAYSNEWYEGSAKAKTLLRFLTLRCSTPCLLTAGGLYVMNFENFLLMMKTSMSYITVFASLS